MLFFLSLQVYQSLKHRYEVEGANPVSSSPSSNNSSIYSCTTYAQFKVRTFFGVKSLVQLLGMAFFMMMILVFLSIPYGLSLLIMV